MEKMVYQAPSVWFDNKNLAVPASCNAAVVLFFGVAVAIWDAAAVWNWAVAVNAAGVAAVYAAVVGAGPDAVDCTN
ncbi:MAG: hypothetical protein J1E01_08130 [Acetatifactor sp.]|nr:hypothetical protein [Acetatifactor sp.]